MLLKKNMVKTRKEIKIYVTWMGSLPGVLERKGPAVIYSIKSVMCWDYLQVSTSFKTFSAITSEEKDA